MEDTVARRNLIRPHIPLLAIAWEQYAVKHFGGTPQKANEAFYEWLDEIRGSRA